MIVFKEPAPSSAQPIQIESPTTLLATEPTTPLATDPATQLRAEISRLQVDNDDLRTSAAYWSRLYHAAIQRATELETQLAIERKRNGPDCQVQLEALPG